MPRKPKPPLYNLEIEPLSGSAPGAAPNTASAVPATFVDDFTGEVMALSAAIVEQAEAVAQQAKQSSAAMQARREQYAREVEEVNARQRRNVEEFLRKRMQPTLRTPAKPGERAIKLSGDLVIVVPAKPWRRV